MMPVILAFRELYVIAIMSCATSFFIFSKTQLYAVVNNQLAFFSYLTIVYFLSFGFSLFMHAYGYEGIEEVLVVIIIGLSTFPIYRRYKVFL
jgi:hypothetical protein